MWPLSLQHDACMLWRKGFQNPWHLQLQANPHHDLQAKSTGYPCSSMGFLPLVFGGSCLNDWVSAVHGELGVQVVGGWGGGSGDSCPVGLGGHDAWASFLFGGHVQMMCLHVSSKHRKLTKQQRDKQTNKQTNKKTTNQPTKQTNQTNKNKQTNRNRQYKQTNKLYKQNKWFWTLAHLAAKATTACLCHSQLTMSSCWHKSKYLMCHYCRIASNSALLGWMRKPMNLHTLLR